MGRGLSLRWAWHLPVPRVFLSVQSKARAQEARSQEIRRPVPACLLFKSFLPELHALPKPAGVSSFSTRGSVLAIFAFPLFWLPCLARGLSLQSVTQAVHKLPSAESGAAQLPLAVHAGLFTVRVVFTFCLQQSFCSRAHSLWRRLTASVQSAASSAALTAPCLLLARGGAASCAGFGFAWTGVSHILQRSLVGPTLLHKKNVEKGKNPHFREWA